MKILIAGLGLIGASLAKTIKKNTNHYVMGWNRTQSVSEKALEDGAVDEIGELSELIPKADITFVNFYPDAIVPFIEEHKSLFKPGSIVTDSCGIKTKYAALLKKKNSTSALSALIPWRAERFRAMKTALQPCLTMHRLYAPPQMHRNQKQIL